MTSPRRFLLVAAVAGATTLASFSADAFWGPFSWMRGGGWGPGWGGWGPGWGGYGYPYGWGYPGWGGWGYPYHGWGYPGWGGYGYPYHGWGYPGWSGWGYPLLTAPVVATQPATTSSK